MYITKFVFRKSILDSETDSEFSRSPFFELPCLSAQLHPGTRSYTIPEPSVSAIPNRRTPVSVWTVFMVILCRKRLPIITPENAERIPARIKGHVPSKWIKWSQEAGFRSTFRKPLNRPKNGGRVTRSPGPAAATP